jgi:membrane associated rhomboid family serine protease
MVFPLYDENPLKKDHPPVVTWTLIAINIVIFLSQMGADRASGQAMIAALGATPAAITHHAAAGGPLPAEATLLTYMFLHSGWDHIFGNMIYLWVFGDDIEEALGRLRFLMFYLAAGVAAGLAHVLIDVKSASPLIGASGAVSGVLAAYLLLRPCAKVSVFVIRTVIRVQAFWVIGAWGLLQLFMLASRPDDHVAYMAHVGGLIAGAALFLALRPPGVELFECVERPEDAAPAN